MGTAQKRDPFGWQPALSVLWQAYRHQQAAKVLHGGLSAGCLAETSRGGAGYRECVTNVMTDETAALFELAAEN